MIVSVILDTEYAGALNRSKWFLKSVSNAHKEDILIVTHAGLKKNIREIIEGCSERFFGEFEMEHVSEADIEKLDICFIPDFMFDELYESCGSRSKQLNYLFNNRVPKIEEFVISYIDSALKRRGINKPAFIMNCLHTFAFVKHLSEHYNCALIPYVFSAIRKVHGYSQTLYMAHLDQNLFNSAACQKMVNSMHAADLGFPILSRKEVLALLGKKHNMPLLPLLERKGIYETGVLGEGYHITPEVYQFDSVTDDDIYYECNRYYDPRKIITRQHPMQLDQVGIGREHMKNDPAAFLLSCNRVVTVQSQAIIKAAIWNRVAVAMSNALPYACLLSRDVTDADPISDYNLNFILFAYFVPDSCMFSLEYWLWRMTEPPVHEIANRHISTIFQSLNIPLEVLLEQKERLPDILKYRGLSNWDISNALGADNTNDVPYDYPTSYLRYYAEDGRGESVFCLNRLYNGRIRSAFSLPKESARWELVLQNDLDGFITVSTLKIDKRIVDLNIQNKYCRKNEPIIFFEKETAKAQQVEVDWLVKRADKFAIE
ncbi:MAG: hypothetical protein E7211_21545 [Clostridium lundense]|nr:hypothetical protein [Clostridium lundense]